MLTTSQIEARLRGTPHFIGVFPCDRLPQKINKYPATLIVNTDGASEPGEHWVAILLMAGRRAEFFCPFGFPPLVPELQQFLGRHASAGLTYNQCTMQDINSTLCGDYCICFVRCVARGQQLRQFVTRFRNQALGGNSNERLLCPQEVSRCRDIEQ